MMAYSEDHIALAAEYALGTLDADERAQVETMMAVDTEFTAIVHAWEYRLGVLNQMVGSVEPRPIVWENIKAAIGHSAGRRRRWCCPKRRRQPARCAGGCRAAAGRRRCGRRHSNVFSCRAGRTRWRNVASVATALAAALVAMLAVQVYQPELLPDALRPEAAHPDGRGEDARAAAGAVRAICRAAAEGRRLARLHPDGRCRDQEFHGPQGRRAMPEPGKSFELWLISDKLPQPRSLGVIGGSDFTARPVLVVLRRQTSTPRPMRSRSSRRADRRRQAALGAGLYRQADRDRAGGAPHLPRPLWIEEARRAVSGRCCASPGEHDALAYP